MTQTMPPVPPGSRSPKGPGEPAARSKPSAAVDADAGQKAAPDQVGQTANTHVNTTNQGLQQDR